MLLRTRFYIPPLRENDVIRHSIIERLQQVSGGEIALVVAPAGYGKTTVVSQWLHHYPHSFAWLVLDQSHSGEQRFWQYTIAAFQTMMPDLGIDAQNQLSANRVEEAVISLLNDLDAQSQRHTHQAMTLVLDDFHKIENPTLLSSIRLFVDHLPPSVRLIITSRAVPDLHLARRKSAGQLVEIFRDDLAFNEQEVAEFISVKLRTSAEKLNEPIKQLLKSTEGWAVGMQLAVMSYAQHVDVAEVLSHQEDGYLQRDVADYLFEEVFSKLDSELQQFLMITALPKRFCTALANELCQTTSGQSKIKQLDQFNAFLIPLDNHRVWFRYHDLFRQLLLQQVSELSQHIQKDIHQRAAVWFENAGYPEDALHHWVKLQEWDELKRVWQAAQFDQDRLVTWQHLIPHSVYVQLSTEETQGEKPQSDSLLETIEPLTKREKQVMEYVKQGLSNKEIADAMYISLNTLKVHIRNLYGKMGVENRTQALLKLTPEEH